MIRKILTITFTLLFIYNNAAAYDAIILHDGKLNTPKIAFNVFQEQIHNNKQDLKTLYSFFKQSNIPNAIKNIKKDLSILKNLDIKSENAILRSAVRKLINESTYGDRIVKPLYLEAIDFLKSGSLLEQDIPNLKARDATVAKIALFYAANDNKLPRNSLLDKIHFNYPVTVTNPEKFQNLEIFKNGKLHIINSGYVFGGQMQCANNQFTNKGIDCSAFAYYTSYFHELKCNEYLKINADPSTKIAAMFSAFKTNQKFIESPNSSMNELNEQIANSPDAFLLNHFDIVSKIEELKEGDLVFWRKKNSQSGNWSGHVVIFGEKIDDARFKGFESIRLDTSDAEGIRAANFSIYQEGRTSYFLTRKK